MANTLVQGIERGLVFYHCCGENISTNMGLHKAETMWPLENLRSCPLLLSFTLQWGCLLLSKGALGGDCFLVARFCVVALFFFDILVSVAVYASTSTSSTKTKWTSFLSPWLSRLQCTFFFLSNFASAREVCSWSFLSCQFAVSGWKESWRAPSVTYRLSAFSFSHPLALLVL